MNVFRPFGIAACLLALALSGCGKEQPATQSSGQEAAKVAKTAKATRPVEEKVPPYSYAAPVKGHVKEANIGDFDLVDGVAYTATNGGGTVIYVVSKAIASPLLAGAACPLTQARALAKLRNASYAEVTLDADGKSKYFAAGMPFGGSLTDLTPRDWISTLKVDADHAKGNVVHRRDGKYEFDLPLSTPKFDQISDGDRQQKRKLPATTPKPTGQAVLATYMALRDAALKKDLKATLLALGFDAKEATAIRGMEGIDADFAVYADRFLTPGTPGDPWSKPGGGQIRGEGTKASGRKFYNDYYFDLCGDRLVLTGIVEQAATQ